MATAMYKLPALILSFIMGGGGNNWHLKTCVFLGIIQQSRSSGTIYIHTCPLSVSPLLKYIWRVILKCGDLKNCQAVSLNLIFRSNI